MIQWLRRINDNPWKKGEYVRIIREKSSYPKFRLGITVLTVFAYIGCALYAFGSVMALKLSTELGVTGLVGSAVAAFLLIPFCKQAMLMGADLVDTTLDKNSRDS